MVTPGAAYRLIRARQCNSLRTVNSALIAAPALWQFSPRQLHQPNFPRSSGLVVTSSCRRFISSESLPTILQPSFWRSLIPKPLRSSPDRAPDRSTPKKKDWNPATFFIVIFLLIGSQAIQMITLQKNFTHFSNQTEARLALLREVVQKVKNGEDVDVEGILGKGDAKREKEWEEIIRELEQEDLLVRSRRQRRKPTSESPNADRANGGAGS